MEKIKIYDTTLRDGAQSEDIAFSVEDKVRIARTLDELGIDYIEGGYPGSNPKDIQFFREINRCPLNNARVAAFGSTCRPGSLPEKDRNIQTLLETKAPVVTIFGKSWDVHPREVMKVDLEENLDMISRSVAFLKLRAEEIIYDGEHFFDGYKSNPDYAVATVRRAAEAGADCIVLCDTNGGTLPWDLEEIISEVKPTIDVPMGIHAHNDSELAVANTILAVHNGIGHVQGTINGYGERCGNANLCSIIPALKLKLGRDCISDIRLKKLREVSRFVNELANIPHNKHQPYVGDSAFAHKGGIHVSAIRKNPLTYEHARPELVGNRQRILVSDQSGQSTILAKAKEYHIDVKSRNQITRKILSDLKELENKGFQFEGAEGSFELLMKKALGKHRRFFELMGFRVTVEKRAEDEPPISEATIMIRVGDRIEHTAALGNGPVNALDNALRKGLEKIYPELQEVKLVDFKVRILSSIQGTRSVTRVLIESQDAHDKWGTVGVSENIIQASWQALVDSIEYKLLKGEK
jgi:2-isopropylmalate synthase